MRLKSSRWIPWAIPCVLALMFLLVEAQRTSTQIVARYPDFFGWAERAAQFEAGNVAGLDWAHGLYPFGYPLLLWVGVRGLGLDVLRTAFWLSALGGVLGLLGAFALIWRLSGRYAVAVVSEFFLGCLGQYLYYGSAESTDMLASSLLIVSLAVLVHAEQRWRTILLAGLIAGASFLVRYTASLTILLCGVYLFTLAIVRRDRAWAIAGGAFILGAVIGGSPQLIASTLVKGNPFYSNQGHNLWFTLTGSTDYLGDWNKVPMDISMFEVFSRFPRQVFDHWWLEFSNFWITNNANFMGRPLFALMQAGLLFVALWRDGLKNQQRFLVGLYAVGHLASLSFMRLDKRFLLIVMPLFVFGAVYFLWQLVPSVAQAGRRSIPVRGPIVLVLMIWAAMNPWGFRSTNTSDDRAIAVSNVLHAAGMQTFREVFSTELYLQDIADPWKHRLSIPTLTTRGIESHEQLLRLLREGGYRFFVYDQATGRQLYPNLSALQFADSRASGLAPIYAPESGEFAVYRVMQDQSQAFRPLDVSLDQGIQLKGYESRLSQNQPPGSPSSLGVYMYWQAERAGTARYKVFVHVVNAQGKLVGQHDGEPQIGAYPTDAWKAGETVCDFHYVSFDKLLPPGTYSIRVGLYNEETGQRVRVTRAGASAVVDHAIVLETFSVP